MSQSAALRNIATNDDADALAERARRLSIAHGAENPLEVLRRAIRDEFAGRIALVSSFGAESAVLLHLVAQVDPKTPVIFLDTGKHFAQTLGYRKKLARDLGLEDVRDIHPDTEELAKTDPRGDLWREDTDACCNLRKVTPLDRALEGFDAWITGRKQFHGGARVSLPVFEASGGFIKVNPIVQWNAEDVEAYRAAHELPPHPLIEQGYPSIGCWPCTHPAAPGEDARSGRWRGAAKTECGIHELRGRTLRAV
ncbi:MAG: phosphoadenylyl-sulfate reductase [Amphiplicatus sp.]|nr:phosphoadenylyl-sulfate reductase [Amphiplicatus sp.]